MRVMVHKRNERHEVPLVSVLLLDWSCRESLHALHWLARQDVPREQYELLWVECYDRVLPDVIEMNDVVITCGQKGRYHKHKGYNVGLLHSRGKVLCVCDSDAVFPSNFISSIIKAFELVESPRPKPLVLMHYEWRTRSFYPSDLKDIEQLQQYKWKDLWPNVGACMSVLTDDAIRFGGFDEHSSLRGYLCGPYDLGWRLINAGVPEIWHDPLVALWHFAHPDPAGGQGNFSLRRYLEISHPHVEYHAATLVEALCTGRLLPLCEHPEIHALRLARRRIGSMLEETLSRTTGPGGFTWASRVGLYINLVAETLLLLAGAVLATADRMMPKVIGEKRWNSVRARCDAYRDRRLSKSLMNLEKIRPDP